MTRADILALAARVISHTLTAECATPPYAPWLRRRPMYSCLVFVACCIMWLIFGMIVGGLLSALIHGVKQVAPEIPWSMVWLGLLALAVFIGGLMGFDEDNHED